MTTHDKALGRWREELSLVTKAADQAHQDLTALHRAAERRLDSAFVSGREPSPQELGHIRAEYSQATTALLSGAGNTLREIAAAASLLPEPPPPPIPLSEQLDRALLGEPGSSLYELADGLTLGLFGDRRAK